jgi:hypothetical protein
VLRAAPTAGPGILFPDIYAPDLIRQSLATVQKYRWQHRFTPSPLAEAIARIAQTGAQALLIGPSTYFNSRSAQADLAELKLHAIVTIADVAIKAVRSECENYAFGKLDEGKKLISHRLLCARASLVPQLTPVGTPVAQPSVDHPGTATRSAERKYFDSHTIHRSATSPHYLGPVRISVGQEI